MDPLSVECPACFAKVDRKCTQATDSSRKVVNWFHLSREARAGEPLTYEARHKHA